MKQIRMNKNTIFFFVMVATGCLLFQNCTQVKFSNVPGQVEVYKSFNGTPYDGKPTNEFFRLTPDFTCEGTTHPSSALIITANDATLIENKSLKCKATEIKLLSENLDLSNYQSQLVGFEDGIFEWKNKYPTSIPANLVEIWCNDSKRPDGLEVIAYYDRIKKEGAVQLYYERNSQVKMIPNFSVARTVGSSSVEISNENGFHLSVYRNQPTAQKGLFKSKLSANIENTDVSIDLSCRVGGSIDTTLWPAKQIADLNVKNFKIAPDQKSFAYTSTQFNMINQLVYSSFDHFTHHLVTPAALARGVENYSYSGDSRQLIFNSDASGPYLSELFSYDIEKQLSTRISEPIENGNQKVFADFKVLDQDQIAFYKDGSHEKGTLDVEQWLRRIDFSKDGVGEVSTPQVVSLKFYNADEGVYHFDISKAHRKVVYLGGGTAPNLYTANFDGTEQINISPTFTNKEEFFSWGNPFTLLNDGKYIWIRTYTYSTMASTNYSIAVDGSGFVQFPAELNVFAQKPNSTFVLADALGSSSKRLVDLKSGEMIDLGQMNQAQFSQGNSLAIFGTRTAPNGRVSPVYFSVSQNTESSLCEAAANDQVLLTENSDGDFYIVSLNNQKQIADVYRKPALSSCVKINSVSLSAQTDVALVEIKISPDQSKMLFSVGSTETATSGSKKSLNLYLVPHNGRPSLKINSPNFQDATISYFEFLADSERVLFVGDQNRKDQLNIYLWKGL